MTETLDVLATLKVVYTIYALAILSLFGWFALRLTSGQTRRLLRPAAFYGYVGLLIFFGIALHILTFNKLPWVALELRRARVQVDRTVRIVAQDHRFVLPADRIVVPCDKVIAFDVESKDLTYGFGLFRRDQTMLFQMQVVPGSRNVLLWRFGKSGVYDIRSTEYSGPAGARMAVAEAVEVEGCAQRDTFASR